MTKNWNKKEILKAISAALPEGRVVPKHNKFGHFYEVDQGFPKSENPVYPSVTGKLQVLKDEGLINYKMNRVIDYVFKNHKTFTENNIMEHLDIAARLPQDILMDAGDVGTRIHNIRQAIFDQWIATDKRPEDFLSFIPKEDVDVRVISAIRALQKFCIERDYIPVACELLVYSHDFRVAGTLDDLGLIRKVLKEPKDASCKHEHSVLDQKGRQNCPACGYQYRYEFVLMDLKTSNAFKDHYFFQVALYWDMFRTLVGIKPERCFILKVSKEDGSYKIEDLKKPGKLSQYAKAMLKTNEAIEFIRSLRKDNQRTVVPLDSI